LPAPHPNKQTTNIAYFVDKTRDNTPENATHPTRLTPTHTVSSSATSRERRPCSMFVCMWQGIPCTTHSNCSVTVFARVGGKASPPQAPQDPMSFESCVLFQNPSATRASAKTTPCVLYRGTPGASAPCRVGVRALSSLCERCRLSFRFVAKRAGRTCAWINRLLTMHELSAQAIPAPPTTQHDLPRSHLPPPQPCEQHSPRCVVCPCTLSNDFRHAPPLSVCDTQTVT
jgi:hypothetical protein